jgi:hypothetical protein
MGNRASTATSTEAGVPISPSTADENPGSRTWSASRHGCVSTSESSTTPAFNEAIALAIRSARAVNAAGVGSAS